MYQDICKAGFRELRSQFPDFFSGIRQNGLIMGLEFNHPEGGLLMMQELYRKRSLGYFIFIRPLGFAGKTRYSRRQTTMR